MPARTRAAEMTGEEIRIAQTAAKVDNGHSHILTVFRPQENGPASNRTVKITVEIPTAANYLLGPWSPNPNLATFSAKATSTEKEGRSDRATNQKTTRS